MVSKKWLDDNDFVSIRNVGKMRDNRVMEGVSGNGTIVRAFLKPRQRITTAYWVMYPGMKSAGLWDID